MLRSLASATRETLLRQARGLATSAVIASGGSPMFNTPGKESTPRRFCVVGSGPAGMYAADRLLAAFGEDARVDVIEKLPTPFGLVRSGVEVLPCCFRFETNQVRWEGLRPLRPD